MLIKTGFDLTFITEKATPMVIMLSIHPSRIDDIVDGEQIVAEPYVPIHFTTTVSAIYVGGLPRQPVVYGCGAVHSFAIVGYSTQWSRMPSSTRLRNC